MPSTPAPFGLCAPLAARARNGDCIRAPCDPRCEPIPCWGLSALAPVRVGASSRRDLSRVETCLRSLGGGSDARRSRTLPARLQPGRRDSFISDQLALQVERHRAQMPLTRAANGTGEVPHGALAHAGRRSRRVETCARVLPATHWVSSCWH